VLPKSLSGGNQHSVAKSLSGGNQQSRADHDSNRPVETLRDAQVAGSARGECAPFVEATEHPKPPSARSTGADKDEHQQLTDTQSEQSGRNLTQAQYKLATKLLNPHFDHRKGTQQFRGRKTELVDMINNEYRRLGLPGEYTVYKLDLWASNSMQRARQQAMAEMHKRDERMGGLASTAAITRKNQPAQSLTNEPAPGQAMQRQQTQLRMPSQFPWAQGPPASRTAWMSMVTGLTGSTQHPQLLLSAQQPTVRLGATVNPTHAEHLTTGFGTATVNATHAEHLTTGFGTGTAIHAQADIARDRAQQVMSIGAPMQANTTAAMDLMQHNSSIPSVHATNIVGSDNVPALAAGLLPMDARTVAETGRISRPATVATGRHVHQVQVSSHLLEQQRDMEQRRDMEQQQMLLRMQAELQMQQRDQTGDARMTQPELRRAWW
jgi:hypothetical protein